MNNIWNSDHYLKEEVPQGKLNLILEECFKLAHKFEIEQRRERSQYAAQVKKQEHSEYL